MRMGELLLGSHHAAPPTLFLREVRWCRVVTILVLNSLTRGRFCLTYPRWIFLKLSRVSVMARPVLNYTLHYGCSRLKKLFVTAC
jgi:hypothetical protein